MQNSLPDSFIIQQQPFALSTSELLAVIGALLAGLGAIVACFVAYKTYRKNSTPDVLVFLESNPNDGSVSLVTKNFGNAVAYNINFLGATKLPVLEPLKHKIEQSFISAGIPMLVPGASRSTVVHMSSEVKHEEKILKYTVKIYYFAGKKWYNRRYSGEFILDYYSYANSLYTDSLEKKMLNQVSKIADSLNKNNWMKPPDQSDIDKLMKCNVSSDTSK